MKLPVQIRLSPYSDDITQLVEWWNHNPYVIGSSPIIITTKAEYGAAGSAPVLGTGGHAFKSHYSD
jgi:hypothetical protein